jgi:MYXO-CTERM domain-containing protein
VALLVSAGLTLSWSTPARADDWPAHGFEPAHGSATPERSGADFRAGSWSYPIPNGTWNTSSPAIADGVAVVGSRDGTVYGLRASTGQLIWKFAATDGLMASPAIHKGRVFLPSLDQSLYALRLTDGKLVWKKNLGGIAQSSPQVVGDSLLVAGGYPSRQLFRIDGATGATLWATRADVMAQFSNSVPVTDGDQVLVGAMEGHLYSFELATGALRWTYDGDGMVNLSAPVISGTRAYLLPGGASGHLHAVELATGKAAAGWPVDVPSLLASLADEGVDTAAARLGRSYAVSSITAVAGLLVFDLRVDDAIDTDQDKVADQFLLRETVVALDPASGQVVWQRANGRLQLASANDIPKNWLCPTPAGYAGVRAGGAWVAVASSLQGSVQILDARSGQRRGPTLTLTAPGRTSPVLANGRLFVESQDGTLESHLSSVNQPPDAPVWSGGSGRLLGAGRPLVEWRPVLDPEGDDVAYELRIDRDGEILESWLESETTAAGATSLRLGTSLEPGVTYVVALRARDARGAWSDWSKLQYLRAVAPATGRLPPLQLSRYDGVVSVERAPIGSIIRLGAGTFRLQGSMDVPAGVSLEGAGPGKTVLDATGLEVGLSVGLSPAGNPTGRPTEVRNLTVTGATVGIAIAHDVHDARIRNVIVRGSVDAGVTVGANAAASLVNLTLAGNGRAIRAAGRVLIKNSIVVDNQVGLAVDSGGAIASTFNDLAGNLVAAYQGMSRGESDLAEPVAFVGYAQGDLHVQRGQPTTDRGDPGDDFAAEPAPNGGRINLGAFGGTAEAEPSVVPPSPVGSESPTAVAAEPAVADGTSAELKPAGEGCAVAGPDPHDDPAAAAAALVGLGGLLAVVRRRRQRSS